MDELLTTLIAALAARARLRAADELRVTDRAAERAVVNTTFQFAQVFESEVRRIVRAGVE
jgi:hypothetical protein